LLPYTNAVVQHYEPGFQLGKSTTDQLFALRQILEKCKEYIIKIHHLFIDFKAVYDTIIRIIAARNERTIHGVDQSVAGDKTFEVVKECVYLGSLVTPNNTIQMRNQTTNRWFVGLRK
jgi:hypothetical protein